MKKNIAVLLVAVSAVGSAWAQAPQAVGKLTGVQGLVTIGAGDRLVNAVTGAPLVAGNRIVTTSSGAATLAFDTGCVVALKPNESITVTSGADCKALLAAVQPVGGAAVAVAAGATGASAGGAGVVLPAMLIVGGALLAVADAEFGQQRQHKVMRPAFSGTSSTGLAGPVAFGAGLLLLAFAPVIRGGNRHVAMVLLEWLGLLVLLLLVAQWAARASGSAAPAAPDPLAKPFVAAGILFLALAPLWTGLIQLTPLPASLWAALPGRTLYVEALAVAQAPAAALRPLSLTPDATWVAVLAGIPLSAVFLLACTCTPRQLTVLARALVLFALAQAVLGLLQRGPFPGLSFDALYGAGKAIGSFANPNHFASYITMTLPLAILVLRQGSASARARGPSDGSRLPVGALWGVALFILLAAVLASNSRAGAITGLLVTVLAALLLPLRRSHAPGGRWRLAGVAALLLLVAAAVGMDALMSRFAHKTGYLDSDRWMMVTSTWRAAMTFWPAGSGLGSFVAVYRGFQPAGLQGFVEHAHNDYLQFLMEGGLLFVALAGLALALAARQTVLLVRRARTAGLHASGLLQASCGLGLLAVLLHSWVDFNLHIPANALSAAFLLGAFLRPLAADTPEHRSGRSS